MAKSTKTITKKIAFKDVFVGEDGLLYDDGEGINLMETLRRVFGGYTFDLVVTEKDECELDLESSEDDDEE